MPRYYFNLADGHRETDDEGVDLVDAAEARRQAVIFLGSAIRDEPEKLGDGHSLCVEVRNGERQLILSVVAHTIDIAPFG